MQVKLFRPTTVVASVKFMAFSFMLLVQLVVLLGSIVLLRKLTPSNKVAAKLPKEEIVIDYERLW